ncbi:MAG: hypothetical protein IAE94_12140 [Chthoniobacterales bacterium]|nr:hypothetical protein [Chthoniobacterales bacterium]
MFRLALRFFGLFCAVCTVAFWLLSGPDTGWSKTSRAILKTDEITGLEYPVMEKRFIPGVDFLGTGLLGSALLVGLSFLPTKKKP